MFTEEHRTVRKKYHTDELASHLLKNMQQEKIGPDAARFLESLDYFFFATSNREGSTNVNFKGAKGGKRLIKVLDEKRLIFPDYKGNGIFHGIGDIASNPNVGLLCIDFSRDRRLKISGTAEVIDDPERIAGYREVFGSAGIERLIEVTVHYLIPNCSRQLSVVRESILRDVGEMP